MQRFTKTACQLHMKKIVTILLVTIVLLTGCKKESSQPADCGSATIQYWGDPAADGLGWVMVIDAVTNAFESPDNLAASYKITGMQVNVCYVKTDQDLICYCTQPFKKKVHITAISK